MVDGEGYLAAELTIKTAEASGDKGPKGGSMILMVFECFCDDLMGFDCFCDGLMVLKCFWCFVMVEVEEKEEE